MNRNTPLVVVLSLALAAVVGCGDDSKADGSSSDEAKEQLPSLTDDECMELGISWSAPLTITQGLSDEEAVAAATVIAEACKDNRSDPEWYAFATCYRDSSPSEWSNCPVPAALREEGGA